MQTASASGDFVSQIPYRGFAPGPYWRTSDARPPELCPPNENFWSASEVQSTPFQWLYGVQLFSSMTACLVLNVLLSTAIGHPGNMSHPGLVSFGQVGVRITLVVFSGNSNWISIARHR